MVAAVLISFILVPICGCMGGGDTAPESTQPASTTVPPSTTNPPTTAPASYRMIESSYFMPAYHFSIFEPGDLITIHGRIEKNDEPAAHEDYVVLIDGEVVVSDVSTDENGNFSTDIIAPDVSTSTPYEVIISFDGHDFNRGTFLVTPDRHGVIETFIVDESIPRVDDSVILTLEKVESCVGCSKAYFIIDNDSASAVHIHYHRTFIKWGEEEYTPVIIDGSNSTAKVDADTSEAVVITFEPFLPDGSGPMTVLLATNLCDTKWDIGN